MKHKKWEVDPALGLLWILDKGHAISCWVLYEDVFGHKNHSSISDLNLQEEATKESTYVHCTYALRKLFFLFIHQCTF